MFFDNAELAARKEALLPRIEAYADLVVNFASKVEKDQDVVVRAPIDGADFVRLLSKKAYEAGAKRVHILWNDDELEHTAFSAESLATVQEVPVWKREFYNDLAAKGACFISLTGSNPDHLNGIGRAKIAASQKAMVEQCNVWRHNLDFGYNTWTIAGVPTLGWAKKVFPDRELGKAYFDLWEAVLDAGRVTSDVRSEWERHTAMLDKYVNFLNRHHFKELHYTSKNGTDLHIGLSPNSLWSGGPMDKQDGSMFYPNIPTEEVFTSPHALQTQGTVYSALPLAHGGAIVRDFWMTFQNGVVTDYGAAEGKDVLTAILEADEGARRLGEVALISKNTPIRESGLLFFNTLYDENASCHLALGKGFPECYKDGFTLPQEELADAGLNMSTQHVDFMVGADDLNIQGTTFEGEQVAIFENGEWAWE